MSGEVDDHGSFFSSDNNNNCTGEEQGEEEEEELQNLPEKQLVQKCVGSSSSRPKSTNIGNGSTSQPQPAAKKKRNLPGNPGISNHTINLDYDFLYFFLGKREFIKAR